MKMEFILVCRTGAVWRGIFTVSVCFPHAGTHNFDLWWQCQLMPHRRKHTVEIRVGGAVLEPRLPMSRRLRRIMLELIRKSAPTERPARHSRVVHEDAVMLWDMIQDEYPELSDRLVRFWNSQKVT